jgi:hypothetical protein
MAHPLANQREPFSDRENYDAGAQGIFALIRFIFIRRLIYVNCSTNPESRGYSNAVPPMTSVFGFMTQATLAATRRSANHVLQSLRCLAMPTPHSIESAPQLGGRSGVV